MAMASVCPFEVAQSSLSVPRIHVLNKLTLGAHLMEIGEPLGMHLESTLLVVSRVFKGIPFAVLYNTAIDFTTLAMRPWRLNLMAGGE